MRVVPIAVAVANRAIGSVNYYFDTIVLCLVASVLDRFTLGIDDDPCSFPSFSPCCPTVLVRNHVDVFLGHIETF
jgi:hypothetical protein